MLEGERDGAADGVRVEDGKGDGGAVGTFVGVGDGIVDG